MARNFHFILLFVVFLTSCKTSTQDEPPITIAISPWAGYSFALLAKELGYFNQDDQELINIIIYPSLSESRLAYINGNVDGLFSTMIEVVESAQQENKSPNIVLVTNFSNGPDKILATKNIKTIDGLKGKRIGVEEASIGLYMLNRALEINNIAFNEFFLVFLGPEDMEKALTDNIIDAVVSYPPYTESLKKLAPNNIFDSSHIQNEIIDLLSIEQQIVQNKTHHISVLLKGWKKAYEYYKQYPNKANKLLQKYPEFSEINLLQDFSTISLTPFSEQSELFKSGGILEKSYINITRLMQRQNLITRKVNINTIINDNILKYHPNLN